MVVGVDVVADEGFAVVSHWSRFDGLFVGTDIVLAVAEDTSRESEEVPMRRVVVEITSAEWVASGWVVSGVEGSRSVER